MWCIAPLFSDVSHEDDLIEISARHRHLLEWDTWTQKPKAGFSETRVQLTDMRPWLTNWDPPLQGEMLIKHLEKTEKFLLAWKLKLFLPCMPLASMFPVVKVVKLVFNCDLFTIQSTLLTPGRSAWATPASPPPSLLPPAPTEPAACRPLPSVTRFT